MKRVLLMLFAGMTFAATAQPRKAPKMAAVFVPGYYINMKNDTVRGQVQINPDNVTDHYKQFAFIAGISRKPKMITAAKTPAYGFEGRHFVRLEDDGEKIFAERIVRGRLVFYEFKYDGKVDGYPAVVSDFFIKDKAAEGEDAELREPRRISNKFYKKALKPYLKDQPMLWEDLDKYTFDRGKVIQTLNEFNGYY